MAVVSSAPDYRVDVGIVSYRTRELTVETVRRVVEVLRNAPGAQGRVLLHDNDSRDGTAEAVTKAFPDVAVEVGQENIGFAGGMNRLLARSDAPWFFALNSDAWPTSADTIGRLVECAEQHPRAALVAPLLRRPAGTVEHSTHPFPSVGVALAGAVGYGSEHWGRQWGHRHFAHGAWQHDASREVDWAVGAAWLMRRSAIEEIGGFDESFFMYGEDLEWCWRAAAAGWQVWFEPAAVVEHLGNASGAAAFGHRRPAAWIANTYRFYRARHGRLSTASYQLLNAVGAGRVAVLESLRREPGSASYWRRLARHHLTPSRGSDRPAGGSA